MWRKFQDECFLPQNHRKSKLRLKLLPVKKELKSLYDESKLNKDYSGQTVHIDPIFPSDDRRWKLNFLNFFLLA